MYRPLIGEGDQGPSCLAKPPTQVKVLAVEEVGLVESLNRFEGRPADQKSCCREAFDGSWIDRPTINVVAKNRYCTKDSTHRTSPKQPPKAESPPDEMQRAERPPLASLRLLAIGVADDALNSGKRRLALEDVHSSGQRTRHHPGVRVECKDGLCATASRSSILTAPEPGVRFVMQGDDFGRMELACYRSRSPIAVVHDRHRGDMRIGDDGLDAFEQDMLAAEGDDDDIDSHQDSTWTTLPAQLAHNREPVSDPPTGQQPPVPPTWRVPNRRTIHLQDAVTPLAEAYAEVHILRPVEDRLVQPPYGFERRPTKDLTSTDHEIDIPLIGPRWPHRSVRCGQPEASRKLPQRCREGATALLRPLLLEHRRDHPDVRLGHQHLGKPAQRSRTELSIAVEEAHDVRGGGRDANVPPCSDPSVLRQTDEPGALRYISGRIRPVVDDHHLSRLVPWHGPNGGSEERTVVPREHDDRRESARRQGHGP